MSPMSSARSRQKSVEFCCVDCRCGVQGKARTFARASLLRQHQLKVHAEKTLKCQRCSKAFAVSYLLRQHEVECSTQVTCKDCGASFAYRSSLQRHYRAAKHGPSAASLPPNSASCGSSFPTTKPAGAASTKHNPHQLPTIVTILPVQILPIFVQPTAASAASPGASGHVSVSRREKPILPKKVVQKAVSVQATRPIQPKLTVSTQVDDVALHDTTGRFQAAIGNTTALPASGQSKTLISVSTSTSAKESLWAPSISTQTDPNHTCNVAVGIDEVFDDLQRLFEKSSESASTTNTIPDHPAEPGGDVGVGPLLPTLLPENSCPLGGSASFHHAETQTQQPHFMHTHIQTSFYKETVAFDDSFLAGDTTSVHRRAPQLRPREPTLVDVGVGGPPFDERIFGHTEVQTASFEPGMQHFGMQTPDNLAVGQRQSGNIAETQTLCVSALDGFSQTGSMELSSVETQTIEQFLSCLDNTYIPKGSAG